MERRYEREKEFDDFVVKLKEQAKSDKPIWILQAEEEKASATNMARQQKLAESLRLAEEVKARREAMRKEAGLPVDSGKQGK